MEDEEELQSDEGVGDDGCAEAEVRRGVESAEGESGLGSVVGRRVLDLG